jgi:hypothetical protein
VTEVTLPARITPDRIAYLEPGQVFVFGSNLRGIHGAGAALLARKQFGAQQGIAEGIMGQAYALPTKSTPYESLPIREIGNNVIRFINQIVEFNTYLVTEIGCGLAGYTPAEIAPLFRRAVSMANVWLPVRHPQAGVVLAGLDQVAAPDGETVAAGRGRLGP